MLIARQAENLDDPPDLVIAGNTLNSEIIECSLISHVHVISLADTVVLTHQAPPTSDAAPSAFADDMPDILEKPRSKADNLRMLLDLNGGSCEVVTGVSVVYPVLQAPGYNIKSAEHSILLFFSGVSLRAVEAWRTETILFDSF